jgi:hypothetical protein
MAAASEPKKKKERNKERKKERKAGVRFSFSFAARRLFFASM